MTPPASSVRVGAAAGRFGELLLGPLTALLDAETPEAVLAKAPALFASISGGLAGVFRLSPEGELLDESWHPANEAFRGAVRPDLIAAMTKARETGVAVERTVDNGSDPLRVWARCLTDDKGSVCAVVAAAPRSSPLGSPPNWKVVAQLSEVLATRVRSQAELMRARAERAQQDRYFRMLDQQLRLLERERQKFVAVVNQSDTYAIVSDDEYNVRWTNTSTSDRLAEGCESCQWIGRRLADVWDRLGLQEPVPGADACPVARAFRESEVIHHEFLVAGDGRTRALYLTALPVMGPEGRPDEVLIMIQDLTNLESLRKSEARYRRLFERSADAMLMVEPENWNVVLANPEASRLLGHSLDHLIGMAVRYLHDPADWKQAREEYAGIFGGDSVVTSERVLRGANGEEIIANMSATRFDLDGAPVALVELQDVTEKRRLEAELRHSQKMEAIGRLAGGVAHDFNNLLAVIQGQSELLISRLEKNQGLRGTAESVRKAAVRGSLLTRQLLAFSRKDVLKPEVLDVRDIVAGIEAMLKSLVGGDVELQVELDDRSCRIEADRGQLEQVIMNLAVNARDAMPRGGNLWVTVARADRAADESGEARAERRVRIEVRDDGIGMDELTQTRLFEPFFTTKEQGHGTGLGLSSAYGIVTDFGGTIEVRSTRQEGAAFDIHFPRVVMDASSGVQDVTVHDDFAEGSEAILVVEDEDDVRSMAVEVLQMMGYTVLQASGGAPALEILGRPEVRVDLLLTDVIMPGMGGGDLVKAAMPLRPDLKVIYMSGYTADDADVLDNVTHDVAGYVQKPFSLDGLSRTVRDALDPARD